MSVLAYPRTNDEDIFRQCTKDCGVVTATEDFQYFALRCIFCSEKFLYFDAFISHMQTVHLEQDAAGQGQQQQQQQQQGDQRGVEELAAGSSNNTIDFTMGLGLGPPMSLALANADDDNDDNADNADNAAHGYGNGIGVGVQFDEIEDLTDADTALLEPQMVIKQELHELETSDNDDAPEDNENISNGNNDNANDVDDDSEAILPETQHPTPSTIRPRMKLTTVSSSRSAARRTLPSLDVKNEPLAADGDDSMEDYADGEHSFMDDNSAEYPDYNSSTYNTQNTANPLGTESDFLSYDEMVEESLIGRDRELTMHIKDRKMIQFLIHSYQRNPFLWDHSHAQFRDRVKRARFLDWIVLEFKNRFNISLAKDAITRKWDNLRTVYKRECNRMSLEKTNISTLWYFKELHFLNEVYSYNSKMSDAVVKETSYRRRFSAIWNDTSTAKLLVMVKRYQCFYNRFDPDYRSKERRGEGLQQMAMELQQLIDVTTIQISKRISQLRFDYSKQKMERLNAERMGRKFIPNYIYYDQMSFMDDDIPPFKCQHCSEIVQTLRELDLHMLGHQPSLGGGYYCNVCSIQFNNADEFENHKQLHLGAGNEVKYNCELCTASFREKSNYDEHLRRHNDELFLPTLALNHSILDGGEATDPANPADPAAAAAAATAGSGGDDDDPFGTDGAKPFACEVCHRTFASPGHLNAHRIVHQDERERCYKCDYPQCNKSFVSRHSLFDHLKQHYSNEEFKCDICGKSFKSTKNLQNHKQIHDKVKRYVCQICGSAFAQAAGLYLHKRRHNRPNGTTGSVGGRSGRTTL